MAKITITIEDLPPGDARGDIRANLSFDPPLTDAQRDNREVLTTAQQIAGTLAEVLSRMLAPRPEPAGNVIEVKPGRDGVLAEVNDAPPAAPAPATPAT